MTITLSRPLANAYVTGAQPWLADGVGVVTGVDTTDYFAPATALMTNLMSDAFVEVTTAQAAAGDCGCVPYYANLNDATGQDLTQMASLWNDHRGQPNAIHLIGAARSGVDLGDRVRGTREVWVFVGRVETYPGKDNLNAEATAHEFTHAWDVNNGLNAAGHCTELAYNSSTLKCLMQANWFDTSGAILPEFTDGRVAYHYKTTVSG